MTEQEIIGQLKDAVIRGDPPAAVELAEKIVAEGIDPVVAFEEGMRAGITQVGEGFANGDVFLPDLVIAADTMKAAGVVLEAEIQRTGATRESPDLQATWFQHWDGHRGGHGCRE